METIRKVTLVLVLAAALAVLVLAVILSWNYRQWQSLPTGKVESLILLLLATSGLYALVFVASSYLSAMNFARQADRSIADIKKQLGRALAELRALKEEEKPEKTPPAPSPDLEAQLAAISQRILDLRSARSDGEVKLELLHYEHAASYLELAGGPQVANALARLDWSLARFHAGDDETRSHFYLNRAMGLAAPDAPLASEIHYDLACWFARKGDFENAAGELAIAFKRQSKTLDARLAHDIEEGGDLYRVANTPPYDQVLNDVLLNVVL